MDRLATQEELERVCAVLREEESSTESVVTHLFWLTSLGLAKAIYKLTGSKGPVKMQIYQSILVLCPEDEALQLAEIISRLILRCVEGEAVKCKTCPLFKL